VNYLTAEMILTVIAEIWCHREQAIEAAITARPYPPSRAPVLCTEDDDE
jgi:hypothetical protein